MKIAVDDMEEVLFFSDHLKRVYPDPSPIPVRVKITKDTVLRYYPTMSGQPIFYNDCKREFDESFAEHLPTLLNQDKDTVLKLNFFYTPKTSSTSGKRAILIYFDANNVTWKVIIAQKPFTRLTMKYYKLYNTVLLQEVNQDGTDKGASPPITLSNMYFDMETGEWKWMEALAAGEPPTNYDTTVSTFRVRL